MKKIQITMTGKSLSLPITEDISIGQYILKCIEEGVSPTVVEELQYDEEGSNIEEVDPLANPKTDFFDLVEKVDKQQRAALLREEVLKNRQTDPNKAPNLDSDGNSQPSYVNTPVQDNN